MAQFRLFAFAVAALLSPLLGVALEQQCAVEQGGGVCPTKNTCCAMDGGEASGCISSGMGALHATCCPDGITGCPKGYTCEAHGLCQATKSRPDPLLQTLPRYALCHPPSSTLETVYGLPIVGDAKLAYYSSHGSIVYDQPYRSNIEMALVVIHGGGRDADDYFCPVMAAVGSQSRYPHSSVLLIAPRFLTVADGHVELNEGGTAMQWGGKGHGRWRFGASAVPPARNVTSFDAIDTLVNLLGDQTQFPNLKHIVLVGHSVGGQFVQRWSLLTSSWLESRMSAVVANPSSWTYLSPMRLINATWQIPSHDTPCPRYNDWPWGLEDGNEMKSPYKDDALKILGTTGIIERFAQRQVTHLIGSADRCNTTGIGQWCQSHFMGTSCMDELQGPDRWDRHLRYVESLRLVGIESHASLIVQGVGHDHALMFTSAVAQSSLFPTTDVATSLRLSMLQAASRFASLVLGGRITAMSLYAYGMNFGS
jgi:pimeloyl-ACP methyl ester carboxylesterase